jgi:hypothetical protein
MAEPLQHQETFQSEMSIVPSTLNADARTVDVVWYGGATVPRVNRSTGKPYQMRLDMKGARLARLNAGAPVFDSHMGGNDLMSMIAGASGMKAQIGVVEKAWAEGNKGMATLRFAANDPRADAVFSKVSQGIAKNLSFGTWIWQMGPEDPENADSVQVATDWEPFEISPVPVPADFGTAFLTGSANGGINVKIDNVNLGMGSVPGHAINLSGTSTAHTSASDVSDHGQQPKKEKPMPETQTTQAAGDQARVDTEAILKAERERVAEINRRAAPFLVTLGGEFVNRFLTSASTADEFSQAALEELGKKSAATSTNPHHEAGITRDETATRRECMEASILHRADPQSWAGLKDKAQEYRGTTLFDIARECLEIGGFKTKGKSRQDIVAASLMAPVEFQYRFGASASTSDFPNILANIATKSARLAYEAMPPTFRQVARQQNVPDFKVAKSVNISDLAALAKLNESGEFKRIYLSDSGEPYSIGTYGNVVSITRQVIINDDLRMLVRVPAAFGQAAARMESDVFWAVITANAAMSDSVAIFHATHANLNTSNGLSAVANLGTARKSMRLQTAPNGTILGLIPKAVVVPAALEQTALQFVNPMQLAAATAASVIPQWVTQLQVIAEGRLDADSGTSWYAVADGDGMVYSFLDGQEGVFTETKMGFDTDGVEIKARSDFGAAMVEFRYWQKNTA